MASEPVGPAWLAIGSDKSNGHPQFIMLGGHYGTAMCWCQPIVTRSFCQAGHEHDIVTHHRSADGVEDVVDYPWNVREDGEAIWPEGQDEGEMVNVVEGPILTAPRRRPDNDDLAERDARPGPPTGKL